MLEKDRPECQRSRIERLAEEAIPGSHVVFDSDEPPTWLRFRIDAPKVNTILGVSGLFHASEIADWSDEKLRSYILVMAPSFA
jgi:hypothetical protein